MGLREAVWELERGDLEDIAGEVVAEVQRAARKHEAECMAAPGHDVGKRLGILVEEAGEVSEQADLISAFIVLGTNAELQAKVGEVARATTYDNGSQDKLREELVQLSAMALAWVYAIDTERA
jgi:hypothetical protein